MIFEAVIVSIVLIIFVLVVIKGINLEVNININQKIDDADKAFLEDLYNKEGDPKENREENTIDDILKVVNSFMTDNEEV